MLFAEMVRAQHGGKNCHQDDDKMIQAAPMALVLFKAQVSVLKKADCLAFHLLVIDLFSRYLLNISCGIFSCAICSASSGFAPPAFWVSYSRAFPPPILILGSTIP